MAFPCGYNHSMASCASSTWQWPMGEKHLHMGHIMAPSGLSPADFRPSADACTKVFCERRKYSAWKAIFSSWSNQHGSFPCIWGGPSSFGGEKKETKTFLLHWFQQCSSFETILTKSLYLHMGVMPDGRLCIRGMQGRTHIFIVIKSTMTPASGSRSFCKIYGPLDFSTFSNQAVSVNDPGS